MNVIDKVRQICLTEENASKALDAIKNIVGCDGLPNFSSWKRGDHFLHNGIEFVFLGMEQGGALCITADPIDVVPFDENGSNDWRKSSIRDIVLDRFLPRLSQKELLPYRMELTGDDGDGKYGVSTELAGILTQRLFVKYSKYIPLTDEWMWTCTPSYPQTFGSGKLDVVTHVGTVVWNYAELPNGCVPAVIFTTHES